MTAWEIAEVFEQIAPLDSGIPGDELGFVRGNPDIEVTGIGCMWSVQESSIRYCIQHNLNLIICHERLWLLPQESPWYNAPDPSQRHAMLLRGDLLDTHGITVYRSHSNWDALPVHGIADSAVAALEIPALREAAREKFFSVQELDEPIHAEDLFEITRNKLGYEGCRIFGDRNKMIRCFAFLIGGFGENQRQMPQAAMELGAEALILGEMSEFIILEALDMGLPVIETLHSVSEIPGIKNQAKLLTDRFPTLPVEYVPSGIASILGT